MRAVDIARQLCPRAKPAYLEALDAGDARLVEHGVTTPLRLAHFLAQVFHESGGLTVERESGSYSAPRILEIFGAGRHSAAVTAAEAKRLARKGEALFERVYGLGNPKKARELGNVKPGDGWRYRGNGLMQTTGRGAHRRLGEKCGLGDLFEREPSAVTSAAHALAPALAEWKESACNVRADRNDLEGITRAINGGLNGLDERKRWLGRILPLLKDQPAAPVVIDPTDGLGTAEIRSLQHRLRDLGYAEAGLADGLWGPRTTAGVAAFQATSGLPVTGTLDVATAAALATAGPRPVSAERAGVTAAVLKAQGDRVVAATAAIKTVAAGVAAPTVVLGVLDQIGAATDKLSLLRAVLGEVPGTVWALAVLAVAAALWLAAQRAQAAKIEAVRTGRDAGPA